MDTAKLIESGEYDENELTELQRNYINGMRCVLEDVLESAVDSYIMDNEQEGMETHNMLLKEQVCDIAGYIHEYMYVAICEMITSMLDENASEEVEEDTEEEEEEVKE